jgi:hypothetical protein
VSANFSQQLWKALCGWWNEQAQSQGARRATSLLLRELWGFVRESTPEQCRQRYGDMDYDWEHRVNTTSGGVGWRTRLLGVFHSAYQPTDPAAFHQMMAALPIDFSEFTFIDIGSGKGRTLLMASEYPFQKIVGVELMVELHRAAEGNVAGYQSRPGRAAARQTVIETACMDAREFVFPDTPLVVYLFNPLPEAAFRRVMQNLEQSWRRAPRPAWVVYHNPLLDTVLASSAFLEKTVEAHQYRVYRTALSS